LFSEFSDLAGALTAFSSKIAPKDLPAYNHDQLGVCFGELDRLIRVMLETVVPSNFVALPLKLVRDTIYATSIDKDAYFENSRFYLAVSADIRDADLIDRSQKLLKACSATQLETLIRNALPGLRLQHVSPPPRFDSGETSPPILRHRARWPGVGIGAAGAQLCCLRAGGYPEPAVELIILLAQPA